MSATAPVWDIKGCSSCLVFCFEIFILGLGLQVPCSCTFAPHPGLVLSLKLCPSTAASVSMISHSSSIFFILFICTS